MMRNLGTNRLLWVLLAGLSFIAAAIGVASPGVYARVVTREVMPGVLSQDWMTLVAAIIMVILAARAKERDTVAQLVILGIVGFLFKVRHSTTERAEAEQILDKVTILSYP
jgi:multisubunit Na+/H+ antiporter MnhF subunit